MPVSTTRRPFLGATICALCIGFCVTTAASAEEASVERRVLALRARVALLEEQLARAGGEAATDAGTRTHVSTRAAGEAAAKRSPVELPAGDLDRFMAGIAARDGRGLHAQIGSYLARGSEAFPELYSFLEHLDKDTRAARAFTANYQILFGLVHFAREYEAEVARFAHYTLVATRDSPKSFIRRRLFSYIPVFLEFHRGKYAELEGEFARQILAEIEAGEGSLDLLLNAARAIGYYPPIETVAGKLAEAATLQEKSLYIRHLESRDDPPAVRVLVRYIDTQSQRPRPDQNLALALGALQRMTSPEAEEAMVRHLSGFVPLAFSVAMYIHFATPRGIDSAPYIFRFLNSTLDIGNKHRLLSVLRRTNVELLEHVRSQIEDIRFEEVRRIVLE